MHNNHDLFVGDYCVDTHSYIHIKKGNLLPTYLCGLCYKGGETTLFNFIYVILLHVLLSTKNSMKFTKGTIH